MPKKIMIIGATSAIAEATARKFATEGHHLFLLGRNTNQLETQCNDLKIRGAGECQYSELDVNDSNNRLKILDQAILKMEGIDTLLVAHGTLPNQEKCQTDLDLAIDEMETNAISTIIITSHLANKFSAQKHGTIAVISSVAGDRGRQSNYFYGAAKGMVSIFMQGLRHRLSKSNVHVLTIKPGFVDTPMTAEFKKGALWATPDSIANGIIKAIEKKKSEVYLPGFWRLIMLIIMHIPGFVFNRLKL